MDTVAYAPIEVSEGDRVILESDSKSILLGMFIVFILPLVLPVAAYMLLSGGTWGILAAAIGLVLAILLIALLSKSSWYIKKTQPRITRVISMK